MPPDRTEIVARSSASRNTARDQQRVAMVSIIVALVLVLLKLGASIQSNSLGLLAEALHSSSDLVAALVTIVAISVSQRPADKRHPWGHGRAEHLAAVGEALLLLAATAYIAVSAVTRLVTDDHLDASPTAATFAILAVVILLDLTRVIASRRAAVQYQSPAFASNALHFGSDLLGTLAVTGGLILAANGYPRGDAYAALVVAVIVAIAGARLLYDNAQVLMDIVPSDAEAATREAILSVQPPVNIRRLRVRRSAGKYLADVVIGVPAVDHVGQGHAVANRIEDAVESRLPGSEIVVHVEPVDDDATLRDQVTAAALAHPGIHEVHNVTVLMVNQRPEISMHVKVSGDLSLHAAHALADGLEESIRQSLPEATHIDVHLEPMERVAITSDPLTDSSTEATIREIVVDLTGSAPRSIRLRDSRHGKTGFITVAAAGESSVRAAHDLATRIEESILAALPELGEVVVHTEPADSSVR